jgi:membrane associated rhomboid family serine protease
MRRLAHILIALLCALAALGISSYFGMLFLMLFDPHYHDGFAAVGGLIIGLIVAIVVFRAVFRKVNSPH